MSWNINQKPRPPLDVLREKIRTLKEKSMKLQWELEVLRNTMNRMKSTCLKLKNENACLKRADRSFENAGGGMSPSFIQRHLRFLIFACHPDRNNGRDEAVKVTRELLKLRN